MGIIAKIAPHNEDLLDPDYMAELYNEDRMLWLTVTLEALFDPDPLHVECHKWLADFVNEQMEYGQRGLDGRYREAPIG